ncbi:MAG: hypothetical protein AB9907_14715 [Flexilinea sp.]
MKLRAKFTTAVSFYEQTTTYTSGQGVEKAWTRYESELSDDSKIFVFFCEWIGTYGEMKIAAQAQGVSDSARVKMPYIPELYNKLRTQKIVIAKHADDDVLSDGEIDASNVNAYRVWGGVDNIREENQHMEFNVMRYEVQ